MLLVLQREPSLLPAEGRIAFLHARAHAGLKELFGDRLVCHQDYKPQADALEAEGFKNVGGFEGKFPMVLLLPDRQREQTLADFARAFDLLEDGGVLLVGLHNDWGARRYEKTLNAFAGGVQALSKIPLPCILDAQDWRRSTLPLMRSGARMESCASAIDGRFWTRPGLFSWEHVDKGSQLLTEHLPKHIEGRVADLGAGWGFLSDFHSRGTIPTFNRSTALRLTVSPSSA